MQFLYLQDTQFLCKVCGERFFKTRYDITRHLEEQHGGFAYKCNICNRVYNRAGKHASCRAGRDEMLLFHHQTGARGVEAQQQLEEYYRTKLPQLWEAVPVSIVELAQSIRKLSLQAYPNASLEMIEVLALDHFIDSLVDTDIRLRIREVGPKSLSEAETMAVLLEAHRIADRQRSRLVGKIEQQVDHDDQENVSNMVSSLDRNVDHLQKRVDDLCKDKNPPSYNNWNGNSQHQNGRQYNNHRNDYRGPSNNQRNQGRQNNYRGNQQYRNNYHNNHNQHNHQSYNNRYQSENCHQPNQGSGSRLN